MKSEGNRSALRLPALFRLPVVTPYKIARSKSSSTFWPRIQRIDCAIRSMGMICLLIESCKQSRHLNDRCVENVENELRCDADGEHQQCYRSNDEFFASQKIRKRAATVCERPTEEGLHGAYEDNGRHEKTDDSDGRKRRCDRK